MLLTKTSIKSCFILCSIKTIIDGCLQVWRNGRRRGKALILFDLLSLVLIFDNKFDHAGFYITSLSTVDLNAEGASSGLVFLMILLKEEVAVSPSLLCLDHVN